MTTPEVILGIVFTILMCLNLVDVIVYEEAPKDLNKLDPSTKKWVFSKFVAALKLACLCIICILLIRYMHYMHYK